MWAYSGGSAAERADDHHLLGRVREVVFATDHVGDAHLHVVDRRGQVVGRRPVGAGDHEVLDRAVLEGHRAADVVVDHGLAGNVDGESPRRRPPLGLEPGDLRGGPVAPATNHGRALVLARVVRAAVSNSASVSQAA